MFLVPKRLPDGSKNAWTVNRLKDKLGSRSMATGEVTYAGAIAYVVGDLGAGFKQMMEMVNGSRLSNAMRAAGLMRRAVLESLVHARQRVAFGRPLAELPLLRSNLLSMLLDAEAAANKAALEIARQNQRRSEVRAPRAGVINTRTVETGKFVRAGDVLATLVDTSRLRLRFKVSEAESLRAQPDCTPCRSELRAQLWPLLARPPAAVPRRDEAGATGSRYLDALRGEDSR